ncbi:hypothetical protein FACS1894132_11090 [Clostridia bacterium]|nr:hypothetical protein FACS1894132_11090 [Clostridia bacterium]
MGKFYGEIGYTEMVETTLGVWQEQIIVRQYFGDVIKNVSKVRDGKNLNDDITIDNRLSIIADPFAYEKFHSMRYIKWLGTFWKITNVEVQQPRLILTIGGVYNEQTN